LPLSATAGHNFFADKDFVEEFAAEWKQLAEAETATVIDPEELRV